MGDDYRLAQTIQEDRRRRAAARRHARAVARAGAEPPAPSLRTRLAVVALLLGLAAVVAVASGQASDAAREVLPTPSPAAEPLSP